MHVQVSSNSLHKCGFYSTLNVKNGYFFRTFGRNTMHFHIFILFRFLGNKRCSKVIFRVLYEKPTHKHVLRRQMTEIGNLTSWPQMTLTSEKVISGLGRCSDMSQTRIMSIHRLLMRLFSEFCGGKAINGKCQTFCGWPDIWRHRWPWGQIFKTLSERSRPGLSIAVWIFSPCLLVSEIDGGRYAPPPPPQQRVGDGLGPAGRGLAGAFGSFAAPLWW